MMNELIQAICWTILHSLWQGLLLTIVAGTVMLITQKASAAVRYRLLMVLFLAFLAVCGYTFITEWNSADTARSSATTPPLWQYDGMGHLPAAWIQYCTDHALVIVTGWLIIFTFRCWQMTRGLLYVRRIRGSRFRDPGQYWTNKLQTLAQQLNIHQTVLLLESGVTNIPVVAGHLKPVIYMPLGLLANLPADQVEAVLLHELAHIRRHDYVINLLQNIAEAFFFFNPGLLWVSSLLKQEREHCCDDVALQHTCHKKQFVEALISFREHAVYGNKHVTAFPGKKNQLLQRVARIVYNRNHTLNAGEKIFFLSSFIVALLLLVAAGHRPTSVSHAQTVQQVPAERNKPADVETMKSITVQKDIRADVTRTVSLCTKETRVQEITTPKEVPVTIDPAPPAVPQEPPIACNPSDAGNQAALDRLQAIKDQQQAERNRLQAHKDRLQADLDREQADKDRAQAAIDRQQAVRDREQADRDRAQAMLDRQQAVKDRAQAEKDRQQAIKDREQSERDRIANAQQKAAY